MKRPISKLKVALVVLMITGTLFLQVNLPGVVASNNVMFSDNFDNYNASPTPIININSPANAAQYAPPTPPWYAASGSGCNGNCETWGGVSNMGPNTIWAVTTERSYSGKNSLELGMNDLASDKTEAHIYISRSALPSKLTGYLHWTQMLWLSAGFSTKENTYTLITIGGRLVLKPGYGVVLYDGPSATGQVWLVSDTADPVSIPLQGWIQLDMVMNLSTSTYAGMCINGQQVLPHLIGKPFQSYDSGFKDSGIKSIGDAAVFGMWVSSAISDQSRARLGNNGEFAFVDNVQLTFNSSGSCIGSNSANLGTSTSTSTTTSKTSTISVSTATTTSSTISPTTSSSTRTSATSSSQSISSSTLTRLTSGTSTSPTVVTVSTTAPATSSSSAIVTTVSVSSSTTVSTSSSPSTTTVDSTGKDNVTAPDLMHFPLVTAFEAQRFLYVSARLFMW